MRADTPGCRLGLTPLRLVSPNGRRTLDLVVDTENAWKALTQANDWIRAADTKAAAVLTASGVLGGLVVRSSATVGNPWQTALLVLTLGCVGASILLALWVFVPRLGSGRSPSLLFFGHVARKYPRPERFTADYLEMLGDRDQLETQLATQLWVTSHIAYRKHRRIAPAIWLLGIALLTAIGTGLG